MAATGRTQFHSDEKPMSLLSATTLVGPATVFVAAGLLVPLAILLRYSFNTFEPRRMMVETFSLDNYVKFFADPYYTSVLGTTLRVAALCTVVCLIMGFPLAYMLARTQSRFKNVLIMLVVLPLFVGNAVRAAGWMTLFGSKGFLNVTLDAARGDHPAAADHVYRGRRHCRHHCRQSALHGADIAERDRRHQSQSGRGRLQSRRRTNDDASVACCCRWRFRASWPAPS